MDLDFSPLLESWEFLLGGLDLTLALAALTVVCSLVVGGAVGLARCYGPAWLRLPLVFYIAAYVAEIVRAGVDSVRPGQTRAAFALGMSQAQAIREVILPQAIVRMLPAFGSIISITIKDTAIAAVIAVPEYMNRSQTLAGQSFHPVEVFIVAMAVYFVILFPTTRIVDMVYARLAHLGRS